jgi:hypothetical protein
MKYWNANEAKEYWLMPPTHRYRKRAGSSKSRTCLGMPFNIHCINSFLCDCLKNYFCTSISEIKQNFVVTIIPQVLFCIKPHHHGGHVVAWLRHCATRQKVASSIPDKVIEFFY